MNPDFDYSQKLKEKNGVIQHYVNVLSVTCHFRNIQIKRPLLKGHQSKYFFTEVLSAVPSQLSTNG